MSVQIVPVTYAPDLDNAWSVAPGALVSVTNFVPLQNGTYGSCGWTDLGWTITGSDQVSAYLIRKVDGTVRCFVNRATNIDEYDYAGTRTNRATGLTSTADWSMCAQGNAVIACSIDNATQVSTGAGFAALGGGSPKAAHCASNRGFVMLANTDTSGDQVWWSALYNYASFTPSIATEAGNTRLLEAPGPITALIAYRDGFVAFKDNALFVAEYVGPNYIWDWRIMSNRIGCVGDKAVVECDGKLYFMHRSGFYEFDGANLRNIGLPLFNAFLSWFGHITIPGYGTFNQTSIALSKVQTAADEIEGTVTFKHSYVYTLTGKYFDAYYTYNVRSQKWGYVSGNGSGDTNQILVRASAADFDDFKGSHLSARFLMIQTVSAATTLQYAKYPAVTTNAGAAFTTGVIGSPDSSGTLYRFHWRTLAGTDNDTGVTITANTYSSENRNLSLGTITGSVNTEMDYGDILTSSRFRRINLTWQNGKAVVLGGVGLELKKAGSPR